MNRKEVLLSPGYWEQDIQMKLYECAVAFMQSEDMNRTQLAQYLGVSKGYVTQLLSGDYNYSLSKLVDLSLSLGFVPSIEFVPAEEYILTDKIHQEFNKVKHISGTFSKLVSTKESKIEWETADFQWENNEAA